jgi:lytic murein transglycosylase
MKTNVIMFYFKVTREHVIAAATVLAMQIGVSAGAQTVLPPSTHKVNPPTCQTVGTFEAWLAGFKRDAAAAGIKPTTIAGVLSDQLYDPGIIARDRRQDFFQQSFLEFSDKLATKNRIDTGQRQIQRHKAIFDRAEADYGVPPEVIAGLWALESDFGATAGMGKLPVLRSLATLAYDCRRGAYFRGQLLDALRIVERGDLRPEEMVGSWAGELGQTQFLPTYYYKYAVDYDGDGRRDLYRSIPDVIGSSANFVQQLGWKRGEPWLDEVRLPATMAWEQADLTIKHTRAQWAQWGITLPDGRPLPKDDKPAALLMLMGRNGPAFLAYANFDIYLQWNQSLNYATTAAFLANRIKGAPPLRRGNAAVVVLDAGQMKELQQSLRAAGYEIGEVDGKLGAGTRAAMRKAQLKLGIPADAYPSLELLERLKRRS